QQPRLDGARVDRAQGNGFEFQKASEFGFGARTHHGEVFVANAVTPRLVQAGLDGADHARFQRDVDAARARWPYTLRAFVHVQEITDAVTGAVTVIGGQRPHRRTCQRIDLLAAGALREARLAQADRALEYGGAIATLLLGGGIAERPQPGDVRRAAQVLTTRIDQQQTLGLQRGMAFGRRAVVRQGAIGHVTGNGAEAFADKTG